MARCNISFSVGAPTNCDVFSPEPVFRFVDRCLQWEVGCASVTSKQPCLIERIFSILSRILRVDLVRYLRYVAVRLPRHALKGTFLHGTGKEGPLVHTGSV